MSARKRSRSSDVPNERKRAPVQQADDLDIVLAKCRGLKEELRKKATVKSDVPDDVPSGILEVAELSSSEVIEGIEKDRTSAEGSEFLKGLERI